MPSIRFRGAFIRYADVRCDDEAGKFIRLHLTADWTDTVRDHMGWQDVPDTVSKATLSGVLNGQNLILTPNGKELKRHELQIGITEVDDFTLVRVKDDEGEPKGTELRFRARTTQPGAAALIEGYIERIGRGVGLLKIEHEKQGNLFSGDDPADKDEDTEEKPAGPALASKAEVERASDPVLAFQKGQLQKVRDRAAKSRKSDEPVN